MASTGNDRLVDTEIIRPDKATEYLYSTGVVQGGGADGSASKIEALARAASARVSMDCDRRFELENYIDIRYDGTGSPDLRLRNPPILWTVGVHHLYVDSGNLFAASSEFTRRKTSAPSGEFVVYDGEGYKGRISLVNGGRFPNGDQTIQVTYDGGYARPDMPPDVELATLRLCGESWQLNEGFHDLVVSESLPGGGNQQAATIARMPPDVVEMLKNYRMPVG